MPQPSIISDPEMITAAWLTEVLQHAGIDATVSDFQAKSIGTGQVGENVRFELNGHGALPPTLVGKFPSPDPVSRATGIQTQNYVREVHFYKHLRDTVSIQTPDVLFTDADPETHDFVLIMEDLAPGTQGDQLGGCDLEAASLAMTQLAHLHGPRWGDSSVVDGQYIDDRNEGVSGEGTQALYDMVMNGFIDRYDDRLTSEEKEMVALVGENLLAYAGKDTGDSTLIHIDYRLDNMMFGGPYPLAVVDWQSVAFACALNDAAYFMGTSLIPEERMNSEKELLRQYFDELQTYDVNLSWDDCWRLYCHHAPAGLIMAVIASMIVGETERGNDMFMAMAKRSARMSRDLGAIDVIRA